MNVNYNTNPVPTQNQKKKHQIEESKKSEIGYGGQKITYTLNMRDKLPFLGSENQNFSIWSIIKDCVGQDMSKITMPIFLNEPLSLVQKPCDMMDNYHVLRDGFAY